MNKLYCFTFLMMLCHFVNGRNSNLVFPFIASLHNANDTVTHPVITGTDDKKVIIGDAENQLEISPMSSMNNGILIQPINRLTNTGLPTAFYTHDTSGWSFYTNATERLKINYNIQSSVPLLINTNENDAKDALRVNGNARFDSTLTLRAASDSLSYISFHRNMKSAWVGEDDRVSPYTSTPTAWAVDQHIPVFRIRHPNNVSGSRHPNLSVQRDFKILPYEFGMAIEFNGVVECWVGEWSVHRGNFYYDVEGKGNGWGGVSWVGDDQDLGGVRMTARNNLSLGGNVIYGEVSVEKFAGAPNGDFRLRLPSTQNEFQFVFGERGSKNVVAKLTNQGLVIPKVFSSANISSAEKGQILFDSTDNQFKGFNGTAWQSFSEDKLLTGTNKRSSNGTDFNFSIPHGLTEPPSYFNVIATSEAASNISYITVTSTHLIVHYNTPPEIGVDNLSWNWQVKK
jgi:hypothetical protein